MELKLIKDFQEFKAGSVLDVDELTFKELIDGEIATKDFETKSVETLENEVIEELKQKSQKNIKKEDKIMDELIIGKFFQNVLKKTITGNNETTAADGGNLVFAGLAEIENLIMQSSQVYAKCRKIRLAKNSNAMKVPVMDTGVYTAAGLPAVTNPSEGSYGTASKLAFDARTLTLTKSSIVVPVTTELMEDVEAMDSYVRGTLVGKLAQIKDLLVLKGGNGYTGINGDTNYCQTTSVSATPTLTELTTLKLKVHPLLQAGAEWFMSISDWATIVGALATEKNVALQNIDPVGMTLLGKPVNVICSLAAGDIIYGNMSQYAVIEAPLGDRIAVSDQALFANDEVVYKITSRGAGAAVAKRTATGDSLYVSAFSEKA
jgi:HK97 family phage major capsid protein